MSLVTDDTPSLLRMILHELPRKRVALVLLVVLVNLGVVTYLRGRAINRDRMIAALAAWRVPVLPEDICVDGPVLPWMWTSDEWQETVWPWR